MKGLFAALDAAGAVHFIGEVPRGAACGCFCPECSSPVVAKQGQEREWHFAHEAGQERPECEAGAMNLLWRLAAEYLARQPGLDLPPCRETVQVRSVRGVLVEDAAWQCTIDGSLTWLPRGAKSAPIATGLLDSGTTVQLFLQVGEDVKFAKQTGSDTSTAELVYQCPAPMPGALRSLDDAIAHIRTRGRLAWRIQPDVGGLVDAARSRLVEDARRFLEEAMRRGATDPLSRWYQPPPVARSSVATEQAGATAQVTYPWTGRCKTHSSLHFYRLKDGSAWVIYQPKEGGYVLVPWPTAEEGWDEALPASIGKADHELGGYRAAMGAESYLQSRMTAMRITSNPDDFKHL